MDDDESDSAHTDECDVRPDCQGSNRAEEEEGEESEEADQDVVYIIDSATMREMKQFYERDSDIDICRRRLHESFNHRCTIAWWYKNAVELKRGHHRFNTPSYMTKLHAMFWKAMDYLTLFRFVGFFFVRDIHQWFKEHGQSDDDCELPFELIELGLSQQEQHGCFIQRRRAYTQRRELLFRCRKRWVVERYDVYIHDQGPVFRPLCNTTEETDAGANVSPVSPFFPLYGERKRIIEAKLFEGDANNFATHPEPFLQNKLLPDADIEDVPERLRFDSDNLADLLRSETTHRVNVGARNTERYISTTLNKKGRRAQEAEDEAKSAFQEFMDEDEETAGDTPYARRLETFDRPSLKSMLKPLPANTSLVRGPPPHVLIKPSELQHEYEDRVCNLMGVPHLYYNPYTHTSNKSSLTPSHLRFSGDRMADSVARVEKIFEDLFYELYKRTLGRLDYELFCSKDAEGVAIAKDIEARMKFEPPKKKKRKTSDEKDDTPKEQPPKAAEVKEDEEKKKGDEEEEKMDEDEVVEKKGSKEKEPEKKTH